MPYIPYEQRSLDYLLEHGIENSGQLNYYLTELLNDYIKQQGKEYTTYNDIVGALECAKLEIYRRVVSVYEDEKLLENGEVYELIR